MHFGQLLRVLRTTAGLSLRGLAKQIGVSPAYLSHVETGKVAPPREERVYEIEQALGLPKAYLMAMTPRVDSEVAAVLAAIPEAGEFLKAAVRAGFGGAEFTELTALVERAGRGGLAELLEGLVRLPAASAPRRWRLTDYLDEDAIVFLRRMRDKPMLFRELARRAARRLPGVDAATVVAQLGAREASAATGIGSGVAVPHATLRSLDRTIVVLAVLRDGVDYGAVDDEPVTVCFLLLGPEARHEEHLGLLARMAQLCMHAEFRDGIRAAADPAAALAFVRRVSSRIS